MPIGANSLLMPDYVDSANSGYALGKQQAAQSTLAKYAQGAMGGDQGSLAQIYAADPSAGMKIQQASVQAGQQQKQIADSDMQRLAQHSRIITQLYNSGDTEGAQNLYKTIYPEASKILGSNLPGTLDASMIPHMQQLANSIDPQTKKDLINLTPGSTLVDPATGKPVYSQPAAAKSPQIIQTDQGYATVDPATGIATPVSYAGGASGTSQAQPQADPMTALIATANQRVQNGEDPNVVQSDLMKSAQAAPGVQIGAPGQRVMPKAAQGSNDIDRRVTDLTNMQAQGIKVSDAQRQAYLTTGKFPEDSDRELSGGEENEAQMLASYRLPVTPYMLSKPGMQPIIQRAMAINPNFAANQYDINKKTLTDLASSNPSTSGGTVTAAQAGLSHLEDMSEISKKLPFGMGFMNAGTNAINQTFNTGDAQSLKAWNTAKGFVAGETAKMVKGGVASEAEVKQLLDSLSPNDPNRDAALATFADFMVKKAQAMEDKKNSIMGTNYQGSLLGAKAQAQARKLIALNPNFTAPQFDAPGSLSNPNQGQAFGSQKPVGSSATPPDNDPLGLFK